MEFNGTITRSPVVRDKVIFTTIDQNGRPIDATFFRARRSRLHEQTLIGLAVGDKVTFTGRIENNPKNRQPQIIIDEVYLSMDTKQEMEATEIITAPRPWNAIDMARALEDDPELCEAVNREGAKLRAARIRNRLESPLGDIHA